MTDFGVPSNIHLTFEYLGNACKECNRVHSVQEILYLRKGTALKSTYYANIVSYAYDVPKDMPTIFDSHQNNTRTVTTTVNITIPSVINIIFITFLPLSFNYINSFLKNDILFSLRLLKKTL